MGTLSFTAAEKARFSALSEPLRDGWVVKTVTPIEETVTELAVRARMAQFTDPAMTKVFVALRSDEASAMERLAKGALIRSWKKDQLAELFFVLGVKAIGGFILYILQDATSRDDLEAVSALSYIRDRLSAANIRKEAGQDPTPFRRPFR